MPLNKAGILHHHGQASGAQPEECYNSIKLAFQSSCNAFKSKTIAPEPLVVVGDTIYPYKGPISFILYHNRVR